MNSRYSPALPAFNGVCLLIFADHMDVNTVVTFPDMEIEHLFRFPKHLVFLSCELSIHIFFLRQSLAMLS